MSSGFGALLTDIKARIGTAIGALRWENAAQANSAATCAADTRNGPARHFQGQCRPTHRQQAS
jgi:hypothetical protein